MSALIYVREDALLVGLGRTDLVVQGVGAVGHGDVSQHADGDDLLIDMQRLVVAGDDRGDLLVAGGNVAGGGDVDKQRGQDQLEGVLVAIVDGLRPGVLDLLEFDNLRAGRGCDGSLHRRYSRSLGLSA